MSLGLACDLTSSLLRVLRDLAAFSILLNDLLLHAAVSSHPGTPDNLSSHFWGIWLNEGLATLNTGRVAVP